MYWIGDYERSVELGAAAHELGGDVHSMEAILRGAGLQAMALTGLGRHEEALAKFDARYGCRTRAGRKPLYLLNYSSMVHRELNDLSVAKQESEEVLERAPRDGFGMLWRFAQSDLLRRSLLEGDIGRAQVGLARALGGCRAGPGVDALAHLRASGGRACGDRAPRGDAGGCCRVGAEGDRASPSRPGGASTRRSLARRSAMRSRDWGGARRHWRSMSWPFESRIA